MKSTIIARIYSSIDGPYDRVNIQAARKTCLTNSIIQDIQNLGEKKIYIYMNKKTIYPQKV